MLFDIFHRPRCWTSPRGNTYDLYNDMLEQPHLLIAGATGSGKSVAINGLMHSIMHKLPIDKPNGAEVILIDPKRVELVLYRDLPHTILYASEPREMLSALHSAMGITEQRYKQMQRQGVRKYSGSDIYIIQGELGTRGAQIQGQILYACDLYHGKRIQGHTLASC